MENDFEMRTRLGDISKKPNASLTTQVGEGSEVR